MRSNEFTKDPSAILDYEIDWSDWLETNSDTISTSTWTVPSGITKTADTKTTTTTTIWLSGGTDGNTYECVNRIVTSAASPRTDERTIYIIVKNK